MIGVLTEILLVIACVYLLLFFLIARLVIPFYGFRKYPPPAEVPLDVKAQIKELEERSPDARAYLESAYKFVQARWQAERLKTLTHLHLAFRRDLSQIWHAPGYAHCQTINFVLYSLLAHSRFFSADDIRLRHIFFNGIIHQYMQVRIGGKWVDADPSTTYLHLPIGRRARLFG